MPVLTRKTDDLVGLDLLNLNLESPVQWLARGATRRVNPTLSPWRDGNVRCLFWFTRLQVQTPNLPDALRSRGASVMIHNVQPHATAPLLSNHDANSPMTPEEFRGRVLDMTPARPSKFHVGAYLSQSQVGRGVGSIDSGTNSVEWPAYIPLHERNAFCPAGSQTYEIPSRNSRRPRSGAGDRPCQHP